MGYHMGYVMSAPIYIGLNVLFWVFLIYSKPDDVEPNILRAVLTRILIVSFQKLYESKSYCIILLVFRHFQRAGIRTLLWFFYFLRYLMPL